MQNREKESIAKRSEIGRLGMDDALQLDGDIAGLDIRKARLRTHERVRIATEECYDLTSIGREMQIGAFLLNRDDPQMKQLGRGIFSQIDRYFARNEFNWKSIYPFDADAEACIDLLKGTIDTIEPLPLSEKPHIVQWFLDSAKKSVTTSELHKKERGTYLNKVLFINGVRDPNRQQQISNYTTDHHVKYADYLLQSGTPDVMVTGDVTLADYIYHAAIRSHDASLERFPDIYTTKWNGISLKDLESKSGNDFVISGLRFISGVPKGDAFWMLLSQKLFYEFPNREQRFAIAREYDMYTDIARKFLSFQTYISQSILFPAFAPGYDNPAFDAMYKRIIAQSSEREQDTMGMSLFLHSIRFKEFQDLCLPEFDIRKSQSDPSISELSLHTYRPSQLIDDPYIQYDLERQAIYYGFDHIRDNFFTRFGSTEKSQKVMMSFKKYLDKSMHLGEYEKEITASIEEKTGLSNRRFLLNSFEQDIVGSKDYTVDCVDVMEDGQPETIRDISFATNTFLDQIGFNRVRVSIDSQRQSYILFEDLEADLRILGMRDHDSFHFFPKNIHSRELTELMRTVGRYIIDSEIRKDKEVPKDKEKITPKIANEIFRSLTGGDE